MTRQLISFVAGLLFAVGLAVGGMTDPNKVLGFLDVTGAWDPSLAFVMGGALLVCTPLSRLARKRGAPLFENGFVVPTRRDVDVPLAVGAAVFGVGWGLGGFCPGPAIVSTMSGATSALAFTGSMLLGMLGFAWWSASKPRS